MGDEVDVDALLEAPYNVKEPTKSKPSHKEKNGKSQSSKSKERQSPSSESKHKDTKTSGGRRSRSRSKERRRRRSRSKERKKKRDHDKQPGSSRERRKSRERRSRSRGDTSRSAHRRSRSHSKERRRDSDSGARHVKKGERSPNMPLTPEERDARTIFIMQLSQRCRTKDVEEFFSSVGKIRDVRLIVCNKTRRFKGIAYVEFKDISSVPLALGLNGQKLLGVPVVVQPSQAEKNRIGQMQDRLMSRSDKGPMRLYVGSLHFNITEDMLKSIFEPFGRIQSIVLITDQETGRSRGYGFITYYEADDAKKALEQMNGFELAGRPIKVGNVTEKNSDYSHNFGQSSAGLDYEEIDKTGVELGATGRLALMAKLAEGTGLKLPEAASQALSQTTFQIGISGSQGVSTATAAASAQLLNQSAGSANSVASASSPPIATQCFMLSNMFDPGSESTPNWDVEIRDDVIEECNKYGGVLHIYVDRVTPQGNVYVKCPNVAAANSSVNALHGRWFAGKIITAAYVPLVNYHNLFPDAISASQLLTPVRR